MSFHEPGSLGSGIPLRLTCHRVRSRPRFYREALAGQSTNWCGKRPSIAGDWFRQLRTANGMSCRLLLVGILPGNVTECLLFLKEGIHDLGIKLFPSVVNDDLCRLFMR